MVSPSVAYIETPDGSGSGLLVEGGFVVTNYHVVWPFEEARVVFPDGAEFVAPVVAWDPMSDTAVLGPVQALALSLELRDGEDAPLGSELFLLGYPGENALIPKPSIVSGVLSQYRQWGQLGITYFQTDAAVAGGQSGGVLVNTKGEVIGISGFSFTEAHYAMVASGADLMPVVRHLKEGWDPWGVGKRRFREEKGAFEFTRAFRNHWDSAAFLLDTGPEEVLDIRIESPGPAGFRVVDWLGNSLLDVDNGFGGTEHGSVKVLADGYHFLIADTGRRGPASLGITSSVEMHPFTDPDDGRRLYLHETIAGSIDYPGDRDWYSIHLKKGGEVRISADSLNIDTTVHIDFPASHINQVAYDDDSGGGLFGTNSQLVYRAPETGEYFIAVQDINGTAVGGYFLSADAVPAGTDGFTVPPRWQEVDSPYGRMILYESQLADFQVQVPAAWEEMWPDEQDSATAFQAVSQEQEAFLFIQEFDLWGTNERQPLADLVASVLVEFSEYGFTIQDQKEYFTSSGDPLIVLDLGHKHLTGTVVKVLVSIQDDRFAFMMYYVFLGTGSSKELAEYSFETFDSSKPGRYYRGPILHVSIVSLERTPELRYSTVEPSDAIHHWALFPSHPGNELVLARLKVENHTVPSVNFTVDRFAAELRSLDNSLHQPISIGDSVWKDFHDRPEALVRIEWGGCFDGDRALIEPGTTVRWQNEADTVQYLVFKDASRSPFGLHGKAELGPGESVSHVFEVAGTYHYVCGSSDGPERPAEVRVIRDADRSDTPMRSLLFLEGPFELPEGHGLDGYMVFEVPKGGTFRDLRWLAGDSVTIPAR